MDVGERGEWEELGREENGKEWKSIGRIEKSVIPILLIQLVTIVSNSYIRTMQINWFVWEGRMDGVGF